MKKFWISFLVTLILLLGVWYGYEKSSLSKNDDVPSPDIVDEVKPDSDKKDDGPIDTDKDELVVLLIGVDRAPKVDLENQGVKLVEKKMKELKEKDAQSYYFQTNNRSDVLYLTKFNKKTGKITMMSIPRDLRTSIGPGGTDKINAAYSYYGPYGALDSIRNFTKVDVEYFIVFDYGAVAELIDSMGGVDFNVPRDMDYEDPKDNPPLKIHIKKGQQVLKGYDAVGFLRYRHGYVNGDYDRIKVQQEFITEFFKQTFTVSNLPNIPGIVNKALDTIYTNVPMDEVLSVVSYAGNVDTENITMSVVPGDGQYIGGISYFISYKEETRNLIFKLFGDNLIR